MDWFSLGSSAIGAIAGLFGQKKQEQFSERQMQFQSRENMINRYFADGQAKLAYDRGVEQWKRENAYNTPAAQMQRMRQAGINPDLAATGGLTQGMSSFSSTPAASAPGGVSPVASPDYNMAFKNAMESRLIEAQTRNIDADTKNKETENSILSTEAKYLEAFKQQQLDCGAVVIRLNESLSRLNDAQIEETRSAITKLNAEAEKVRTENDVLRKQCESLDQDIISKKIHNWIDSNSAQSIVSHLANVAKVSESEAKTALSRYLSEICLNNANARKANADAHLTEDNHGNILANVAASAALSSVTAQSIELSMADEKNYREVVESGTTFGNCLKYLGEASRAFSRAIPTIKLSSR